MRTKVHTLLFFSPNVNKTSFAGILPKWKIPMSSGIFQWNDHRVKPRDIIDYYLSDDKTVKVQLDVLKW